MRAMLFQFEDSQWWPPELVERKQLEQLSALVTHARETVPHYRDSLRAAGLEEGEPLTAEAWRCVPILSRAQVQALGEQLRSGRPPAELGEPGVVRSSGSTGSPVRVLGTPMQQMVWGAITIRDHLWHRRNLGARMAMIRTPPDSRRLDPSASAPKRDPGERYEHHADDWGRPVSMLYRTGPCDVLGIFTPLDEQLRWLQASAPAYLLTYPTNALALAEYCLARGETIPSLREVRFFSESLPDGVREACRQAWNVPSSDMYSAREVGYFALQCPEHPHYHVQSESMRLEVLRDDGSPCAPGEVGRVVVTPLHAFAQPLLRYEIGDLAEVGPPCPCGRGLPVLSRVLGRVRNMVVLADGTRRWPTLPNGPMRQIVPYEAMQYFQHPDRHIEVRIVSAREVSAEDEASMRAVLTRHFGEGLGFTFSYPAGIERTAAGKFEQFRSEAT